MFSLGVMYENGQGVPQSFAKAIELYEQAAAKGQMDAPYSLGRSYRHGLGVEQDLQSRSLLPTGNRKHGGKIEYATCHVRSRMYVCRRGGGA